MNFIHEYALLLAIAIPVAAIVGLNLLLVFGGERGTLLFPSAGALPTGSGPMPRDATPVARTGTDPERAANEEGRKAA